MHPRGSNESPYIVRITRQDRRATAQSKSNDTSVDDIGSSGCAEKRPGGVGGSLVQGDDDAPA